MRAPMGTLSLLWYHTVARPFFALDGSASADGIEEAERLLNSRQSELLRETVLFLFFQGRVMRLKVGP